jgi:O-antigen/teichoic acid export membrane protein
MSAPRLSFRANFTWVTAGQVTYAITQGISLVVLARLTTPEIVGHFAVALAITTPLVELAHMRLRDVLATDAAGDHSLAEYLTLVAVNGSAALVLIAIVTSAFGYTGDVLVIVLLVGLSKVVELLSQILYGAQQRAERMDRLGVSLMLRGVLGTAGMAVGVLVTGDLAWGIAGILVAWGSVLVAYDWPRGRQAYPALAREPMTKRHRLLSLARMALPLGAMQMLISLSPSIPRLFLERTAGATSLGVFTGMAYLIVGMSTVARALAQTAAPRLGQRYTEGDMRGFLHVTRRQVQLASVMGVLGLVGAVLLGKPLLTTLYGAEYGAENQAFVALMVYATALFISMQLLQALVAARRLREQLILSIIVVAATVVFGALWIEDHGIGGAVAVLIVSGISRMVGSGLLLRWAVNERRP